MKDFIGFIKKIRFINETDADPIVPTDQIAWDASAPWDNQTYWS